MEQNYVDCLAKLGVGGAHPGGLQLSKKLLADVKFHDDMFVLDAGCGTGQTAAHLAGDYPCRVYAIDENEQMVNKCKQRFAQERLDAVIMQENVEKLPFANDSFDLILAESVIAFTNLKQTIAEFKRVLKPAGQLFAIEITRSGQLLADEEEMICAFYGFTKLQTADDWRNSFLDGGFTKVDITPNPVTFMKPDLDNAPDFRLDDEIDPACFDMLGEHEYLTKSYQNELSYYIFRCM